MVKFDRVYVFAGPFLATAGAEQWADVGNVGVGTCLEHDPGAVVDGVLVRFDIPGFRFPYPPNDQIYVELAPSTPLPT